MFDPKTPPDDTSPSAAQAQVQLQQIYDGTCNVVSVGVGDPGGASTALGQVHASSHFTLEDTSYVKEVYAITDPAGFAAAAMYKYSLVGNFPEVGALLIDLTTRSGGGTSRWAFTSAPVLVGDKTTLQGKLLAKPNSFGGHTEWDMFTGSNWSAAQNNLVGRLIRYTNGSSVIDQWYHFPNFQAISSGVFLYVKKRATTGDAMSTWTTGNGWLLQHGFALQAYT